MTNSIGKMSFLEQYGLGFQKGEKDWCMRNPLDRYINTTGFKDKSDYFILGYFHGYFNPFMDLDTLVEVQKKRTFVD